MKRVFIDTNVLIDLLADRKPFSKQAVEIFSRAEGGKIRLFVSSHSIATTHYLLKKHLNEKSLRTVLNDLLDYVSVIPIDMDLLKKGQRSKHSDFEDALQVVCATSVERLDGLVTRNVRDFKGAEVPVMTPAELCMQF
ncbi:MAG: type II toxin-antitoxin system VapC family toxin [Bacteroidota bacterium]